MQDSTWPDWLITALDQTPWCFTTRLAAVDWLLDHDGDASLAQFLRWQCAARALPCRRRLSTDPNNLATGYGWYTSQLPKELWPSKTRRERAVRIWVWPTRHEAEDWVFQTWKTLPVNIHEKLIHAAQENR